MSYTSKETIMAKRFLVLLLVLTIPLLLQLSFASAQPANMSTDEAMYAGRVMAWTDMMTASMDRTIELLGAPRLGSQTWQDDVFAETAVWAALYENARIADVPPRFIDSHRYFESGFKSLDQSGLHLRRGVEDMDDTEIDLAVDYLNDAAADIERAMDLYN
jgi:hypothetical protein